MKMEYEQRIEAALTNIFNRLTTIHEKPIEYIPDLTLYPQQIHTIDLLGIKGEM